MSNKLELYVYTTPTWKKKGLLKVGHCDVGRHKKRIGEQFNAANPEKPIILWVKPLPDGITDNNVHAQMEKNGIERKKGGAGREWFYATLDDVQRAYNEIVYGTSRKNSFSLREEQQEAVARAAQWFKKDH